VVRWAVPALLAAALGIALAPSLLTPWVSRALSTRTGIEVRVGWIAWNPLAAGATLHDVTIAPAAGMPPIVTLAAVHVDVAARRLVRGEIVLERLVLRRPWVGLTRTAGGDFNVAALFGRAAPTGEGAGPRASWFAGPVRVEAFRVAGGSVDFRDETISPALETSFNLEDVNAADVTLAAESRTAISLRVKSSLDREPLIVDLDYHVDGADSSVQARLATRGASLARSVLYLPIGWQRLSGTADLTVRYTRKVVGGEIRVHQLRATGRLTDLALAEPWLNEATLTARRVRLGAITVDLLRQHTDLRDVRVADFAARVVRDERGVQVPLATPLAVAPDTKWKTTLAAVSLGAGTVVVENIFPGGTVRARVHKGMVTPGRDGATVVLDGTVAGGSVMLEASAGAAATRLRFTLQRLELPEVGARLRLPVGFATGALDGTLTLDLGAGAPHLSGTLSLPGGKTIAPDAARPEDVVAWQDLGLEITAVTLDPLRIHVGAASATWPYVMVHRHPGGTFPWAAAGPTPVVATPATAEAAAPVLVIDEAILSNGRIEFYDTTLRPPFGSELAETEATLRDLRLAPLSVGGFEIRGAIDEIAPLEVRGSVGRPGTRLDLSVARLRLAPLSPYIEPLLQYEITSGLARIDASVRIEGSELRADNDVVLSRFAMARTGQDALESELGAPVSVALALMKDARGDIHLTLPVRGDLAAREYRVRNVFGTALRQSLLGALRAPLTLVGAAFRRDQGEQFDLRPVPFAAGSAALDPAGSERIAQVARLLGRHGELRVVLMAEPSAADVAHLRDAAVAAEVEAKDAAARTPTDQAVLAFVRTRLAGATPSPLAPDAAAALAAREAATPAPEAALRVLADARIAAVAQQLAATHGVARDRIERTPWEPEEPRDETPPGVDVQLRGG
jgi:hypothetical protein